MKEQREEEMIAIESIFAEEITEKTSDSVNILIKSLALDTYIHFEITFNVSEFYPNSPPTFKIHSLVGLGPSQAQSLHEALDAKASRLLGKPMIYELVLMGQEYINEIVNASNVTSAPTPNKLLAINTDDQLVPVYDEKWEIIQQKKKELHIDDVSGRFWIAVIFRV